MDKIELKNTLPEVFALRDDIQSDIWHREVAFERGHLYLVEAGSGTGKSSLCSYIIGYRDDYQGIICFDGKNIRTLEGLLGPGGELSDIQQAFIDEAAIQCGFCTPGFIMTAVEILESGKEYTDEELRKLLSGHLCRCTGYENILRAVKKTMLKRLGKA